MLTLLYSLTFLVSLTLSKALTLFDFLQRQKNPTLDVVIRGSLVRDLLASLEATDQLAFLEANELDICLLLQRKLS